MTTSKPIRILLIDNENDSLEFDAFEVKWETSYLAGKLALLTENYDICFLSYRLEGNTGLALLQEVITDNCIIPIIILTENYDHQIDLQAMQIGAADYLAKDQLTSSLLEKTIRYSIHRAKTLESLKEHEVQVVMSDRFASVGLLASSLAHEIGTPLGVIRGRAEFLELQRKDDPFVKKNIDTIISQIDRVSQLIKSLLNLAHGTISGSSSGVFLHELIKEVTELLAHEFRKHNITLINEFEHMHPAEVCAEVTQFHQVLLSVLINSIHAIETAIALEQNKSHSIRISIKEEDEFYCVSVQDDGCGISEKNLRNLFKPFFTTKDIGKGIGLGLTISYRIVQSWCGKIQVESKENAGTKILIFLPKFNPRKK